MNIKGWDLSWMILNRTSRSWEEYAAGCWIIVGNIWFFVYTPDAGSIIARLLFFPETIVYAAVYIGSFFLLRIIPAVYRRDTMEPGRRKELEGYAREVEREKEEPPPILWDQWGTGELTKREEP